GTARGADLKKYLTHIGYPPTSFAAWWKKAKAAAVDHPRLDDHEAYRDVMHLVREGAAGGRRLPMLDPKKGPRAAVTLVNRFLAQHPAAFEQSRERYAPYFEEWIRDGRQPLPERAYSLLMLSRWFPDRAPEWGHVAAGLEPEEIDAPNWSAPQDQRLWIELLATDERWNERIPPFLGSRRAEIRSFARELLNSRWGERAPQELAKLL